MPTTTCRGIQKKKKKESESSCAFPAKGKLWVQGKNVVHVIGTLEVSRRYNFWSCEIKSGWDMTPVREEN